MTLPGKIRAYDDFFIGQLVYHKSNPRVRMTVVNKMDDSSMLICSAETADGEAKALPFYPFELDFDNIKTSFTVH